MQDRYVGDIGDFGKYALLNALCRSGSDLDGPRFSLGVVWYLVPDEPGNDGKLTGYLDGSPGNRARYRECDPALYDALAEIVVSGNREVAAVRRSKILPRDTVFYEASLSFEGMAGQNARLTHRRRWVDKAVENTARCDLVFIDPDNGLEVPSTARHQARGPKYCYLDELSPYVQRGQSLVLYQHLDRRSEALSQVEGRLVQLAELRGDAAPFALRYRRGTSRTYLILPAPSHRDLLSERALRMVQGPWGRQGHFSLVNAQKAGTCTLAGGRAVS